MASLIPYNNYQRAMRRAWPFDAFDEIFDAPLAAMREAGSGFRMNVEDAGSAYVITAELPGVTRDQIDVELNEGRLSVGDDIMLVLIGGDIRPRVIDALQSLVGEIKSGCVREEELY